MHPIAARIAKRRIASPDIWNSRFPAVEKAVNTLEGEAYLLSKSLKEIDHFRQNSMSELQTRAAKMLVGVMERLTKLSTDTASAYRLVSDLHQHLARAKSSGV